MVDLYRGYNEGLLTEDPTRFSDIGVSGPDFLRGMKYTPFDFVGAPVDLLNMGLQGIDAMYGQRNVLGSERPFLGSEDLINRYADLGGLMGVDYDRPTGSGSETLGRIAGGILAPTVGAQTVGRVVDAGADYIAGAPARVAGRARSVTLGSGIDPTAALDDMIVRGMGDNNGVSPADTPRGLLDQPQAAQGEPVGLLADDPVRQMDTAQARYFETGKFEPPTAENPVSIVPPTPDEPGIIAFHGSGADFDEFRLEMIGTGEGAQAYGYGLYFTDSEDIAGFYKNMMTRNVDIDGKPYIRGNNINDDLVDPDIADDLGATNGDLDAAIKSSEEFLQEMVQADNVEAIRSTSNELEKLKQLRGRITVNDKGGKIYKVGLAPKPDELLDYDLPLSQQPKMLELIDDVHGDPEIIIQQAGLDPATATGGDFVKALGGIGQEQGAKAASEFLAKAGIPGIKFFSGNTRNTAGGKLIDVAETTEGFRAKVAVDNRAGGLGGSGRVVTTSQPYKTKQQALDWADEAIKNKESNYVIFDDKAVKILEKYGIVGPVLVTGAGMAREEQPQPTRGIL